MQCIQTAPLWQHLVDLQAIADANPDADGHGNRDTGTPGYKASVDYVANLVRKAGYLVTVQSYPFTANVADGQGRLRVGDRDFARDRDWFQAGRSIGGAVTARVQAARGDGTGCHPSDLAGFDSGRIALMRVGDCRLDVQAEAARRVGAVALIVYNDQGNATPTAGVQPDGEHGGAYPARLHHDAALPVLAVVSHEVGMALLGAAGDVRLELPMRSVSGIDYNLIAESRFGDSGQVVVAEGHLDSIYGAGILDNGSGSSTLLEIALNMANTPTRNKLRFIWFGGEELGLLGSHWYTRHLSDTERGRLAFDVDVDVTATPNYDYLIADPANATDVQRFPPNVVADSQVGTGLFREFFAQAGAPVRSAGFGNDGTDSNSFALIGIPNTGILTQQDCCKHPWEVKLWGGSLGNYEGQVPGWDGGCIDNNNRWCDNLSNNNPVVMTLASRAAAYVVWNLANQAFSGW